MTGVNIVLIIRFKPRVRLQVPMPTGLTLPGGEPNGVRSRVVR